MTINVPRPAHYDVGKSGTEDDIACNRSPLFITGHLPHPMPTSDQ